MNTLIAIDSFQRRKALNEWLDDCKKRMAFRFPKVRFNSDSWQIKKLYGTAQNDFYFKEHLADLVNCDRSYRETFRCLVAEYVLAGKPKIMHGPCMSFRVFAKEFSQPIFNLGIRDLAQFEQILLDMVKNNPVRASGAMRYAASLEKTVHLLSRKGVTTTLGFFRKAQFKAELSAIINARHIELSNAKAEILDHQIEAFNEAFNAMIGNMSYQDGTPVLTAGDELAICVVAISLCAPSRINEVLLMSIDDYITVEDYVGAHVDEKVTVALSKVHQMLIITQKGSKGAEWGAKPVLQFMIDVFHYCIEKVKKYGARSRMLIEWYQMYPNKLYLPAKIEYLRGQALNQYDLGRIICLESGEPSKSTIQAGAKAIAALKGKSFQVSNPNSLTYRGGTNPRKTISSVSWTDAEEYLLSRVKKAIRACYQVTKVNDYIGDLSKMLFLFDSDDSPFLPGQDLERFLANSAIFDLLASV
ncbi:hypothetical protein [Oceanisphaera sp. IT1-181]|uniref:hypothetical protein n=1 Tax=Oceanisphaera sp. IT1-181 TaxID=3081199 RepID=UPI0029CA459F|nr:hypothetical protein [Oceanisphaera sp. IT1-181]